VGDFLPRFVIILDRHACFSFLEVPEAVASASAAG
jgi:hypothetical protein